MIIKPPNSDTRFAPLVASPSSGETNVFSGPPVGLSVVFKGIVPISVGGSDKMFGRTVLGEVDVGELVGEPVGISVEGLTVGGNVLLVLGAVVVETGATDGVS